MRIITERLEIVPISLLYKDAIFKEFTKEITELMHPKPPTSDEDTVEYIKSELPKYERGEELPMIILEKNNQDFLGCVGIHFLSSLTPELGIWIKKLAQGNGYGKEAVNALKRWGDDNLDYEYLTYPVDKANVRSRRIAESIGGIIRREFKKTNLSGRILDEVEYWIYKTKR